MATRTSSKKPGASKSSAQSTTNSKNKPDVLQWKPIDNHKAEVNQKDLKTWYSLAQLGRLLDEKAPKYLKQAKGWSYHAACTGHEGIQLALGLAFRQNKDFLFPYYRDLLTCLAAGITPEEIIMNGISKAADVASGGRHMSNHFAKPSIRIQNVSSCTGNHTLHAVGVARAIKYYGGDEIAFSSQGEASASEGYVFEAISGASREKLPVVFVIQNNRYGISVPIHQQSANVCVADNFAGIKNLHVVRCDGTNVFDADAGMKEALQYVRSGKGPAIVHADCVRIHAHSNSDNQALYRSEEEIAEAWKSDPVARFRKYLIDNTIFSENDLKQIEDQNQKELDDAAKKAEESPDPDPSTVTRFVIPEATYQGSYPDGLPGAVTEKMTELTLLKGINRALKAEFRRNKNTFLWGQDVASKEKGGVFNVTKGMAQEFGEKRIFNAPIAEDFIVGTANGMCRFRDDIWVVIEGAQFADYFWPAMEQLIECSHDYWRSNGQFAPNILIRLSSGGYIGGGLYHSQNLEGLLTTLPGIRVVAPAFGDDAYGMVRNALQSRGVTLFLEPKFLYNQPFTKSFTPEDFTVPFGKARVRKEGEHLSIFTYGTTVHLSLRAANKIEKELGATVEVVDLRSLSPLDTESIIRSVKKTGKALVVHEDKVFGGFGGEIVATINKEAFEHLDGPVERVGSIFTPVGFSRILERATLPSEETIFDKAAELIKY